jgi:hypothetical protein
MRNAEPLRIADRLRAQRRSGFVGREAELAQLLACAREGGPAVTFLLGIGGVGKTSLLEAFAERLGREGIAWCHLDCDAVAPTEPGFLAALGERLGRPLPSVAAAAAALSALGSRVVLILDAYDRFRLLDAWLREELVPALPASVRVVLSGRKVPVETWACAPGWSGLIRTWTLGPLPEDEARTLLERLGVGRAEADRIARVCGGHPLALQLAAQPALAPAGGGPPRRGLAPRLGGDRRPIVEVLAPMFLRDVPDPTERRLLEAACLVRRATRSILDAMVPDAGDGTASAAAIDRLRALSFVEVAEDGLKVHETVRAAVAANLESQDPARYHALRSRAWSCLRTEVTAARNAHLWRYTADMLYLIDQPTLRTAFFPGEPALHAVEAARPDDGPALLRLVEDQDPADVEGVRAWWEAIPRSFRLIRAGPGAVAAFYTIVPAALVPARLRAADPVVDRWCRHLRDPDGGLPAGAPALFARRLLARETDSGAALLRAACWLDVKRAYLEHAAARRLYVADHRSPSPAVAAMGFEVARALEQPRATGAPLRTLVLEFGPDGVLGWMARLVDAQIGARPAAASAPACELDEASRALRVAGRRVPLTRLEFGVLRYLRDRPDQVIGRDELLREVWQQQFGGSNVVDAAVRSLRKKLGPHAGAIATETGHGYRFVGFGATPAQRR